MNKRGQSHIEFIVSFVLFTTFVVLILFLFKPSFKSSEIGLNSIENSIMAQVSTNVSFYSVKSSTSVTGDCFCFKDNAGEYFVAKNADKEIAYSFKSGADLLCIKTDNPAGVQFYYVYLSDEFESPEPRAPLNCLTIEDHAAEKGPLRELSMISSSLLLEFNESYFEDYENLKQKLELSNYDFGIQVIDSKGNVVIDMSRRIPLGRPVYSRDVPAEIIYKDGSSSYDIMRISAW